MMYLLLQFKKLDPARIFAIQVRSKTSKNGISEETKSYHESAHLDKHVA